MNDERIMTPPQRVQLRTNDAHHLTCAVVVTFDAFLACRSEWSNLVALSRASVYQTFEWNVAWWKALGESPNRRLHLLLFRDRQRIVGIAPFFEEELRLFGATVSRRLSLLGSGMAFNKSFGIFFDDGPSDFLDIISSPGYEQGVAASLAKYVKEHQSVYDEVELLNAPETSIVLTKLIPLLRELGASVRLTRADLNSRIILPGSLQEYLRGLGSNVRRRFSQARQAVDEKHIFEIREVKSEQELEGAFRELVALHLRRWNDMGYPGYFADTRFFDFQRSLVSEMLTKGSLWFKTVWADGRCVGARLGFILNGAIYDYLTGFDKESANAKYRPGYALLLSMIEDAISTKCTFVELLRGDERYKSELCSVSFHSSNIVIQGAQPTESMRTIVWTLVRGLKFVGFLVSRELVLIRVQYSNHGAVSFLYHWAAFRASRFLNKAIRVIERDRGINNEYQDNHTFDDLINILFSER